MQPCHFNGTTHFLPMIVILLFSTIVRSELDLIWEDALEKYSSHWFTTRSSSPQPQQINDDLICPSSSNCVHLKGNEAIIRKVHLDILHNLKAYDSFLIQTTATSTCKVAYKYAGESDYRMTEGSIPIDHSKTARILQIQLSASGSGDALCYFDDIRLFGDMPEDNTILFDTMEDIHGTNWIKSDDRSEAAVCDNNHMYKSIPNVRQYTDIHVQFDIKYTRMSEEGSRCQISYRYDTEVSEEWYILRHLHPKDGTRHIVTIHEDPHRHQSSTLFIKFAHKGDSCHHTKGKGCCHFSNVYVKGRKMVEDDPRLQLAMESRIASPEARADRVQNVIIIGDMGDNTSDQEDVADMMASIAKSHDIEGIIALGDNIYEDGVEDEYDDLFDEVFEDVYTQSSIRNVDWYFTTGNHDYRDNITGEVEYSRHSDRWNFPDLYYTKTWRFGSLKLMFIALDTYILCGSVTSSGTDDCRPKSRSRAEKHWDWLEDELRNNDADFVIVGGHTPIFSYASHGPVEQLIDRLKPLLEEHNVAAHIFGHDHELQFIEEGHRSLQYIGSGAGHDCRGSFGMKNNKYNPGSDALKYMDCDDGGFVRLAVDTERETMKAYYYLGDSSSVQFTSGTWVKGGNYCDDGDDCGSSGDDDDDGGNDGGNDGGSSDNSANCLALSGFDSELNGEWAKEGTHDNEPYYERGSWKLFYDSENGNIHIDDRLGTSATWYCEGSSFTGCTANKWYSQDRNNDWNDDADSDARVTECGGSSGGGGGSSNCIQVSGLDGDLRDYNGEWQPSHTYYKKGRSYLLRSEGYWTFTEDTNDIDWSTGWCGNSNVETCDRWDSYDGNYDVDISKVSCGSARYSYSYAARASECVQVKHLESKFNKEWKADGKANGRTMYTLDSDYWLFSERKNGIDYWTISSRKGDSNGWGYGWCSASTIESCSGEWDYGNGKGDRNCEFELTDCNSFTSAEEPLCLQDNDYHPGDTVCVSWHGESLNFELSHEECVSGRAVYYHDVSEDERYYLHFDNSSIMGEQWMISVNQTEAFGGTSCRELDLLKCVKGKWMDDETQEPDEYTAVANGDCRWKMSKETMMKASVIICIVVLAVVIVGVIVFGFKYYATRRTFKKAKSMVVAEDEDSAEEDRDEIWIEKEIEIDGDETNTQLNSTSN